jgi:hypothetical protein
VLYECALLGLRACGTEINPAAVAFAKIYELSNCDKNDLGLAIADIEVFVSQYTNDLPLHESKSIEHFEGQLITKYKLCEDLIQSKILFALITGLDFDTKKLDVKRINNVWGALRANVENLPHCKNPIECHQSDARKTPLKDGAVNFVVTSPPYINVFNYHQNYRKSIEKTGVDVLQVAKSEIGANRKFRQNRFLTVVQYCMDIAEVFIELRRVCKPTSKIFFIVGRESNVRGTPFKNAELIFKIAKCCGFEVIGEQTRVFTNKFGESIYEEIMRISVSSVTNEAPVEQAREIGRAALKNAILSCAKDVKSEISEAIEKSLTITTSPILGA